MKMYAQISFLNSDMKAAKNLNLERDFNENYIKNLETKTVLLWANTCGSKTMKILFVHDNY